MFLTVVELSTLFGRVLALTPVGRAPLTLAGCHGEGDWGGQGGQGGCVGVRVSVRERVSVSGCARVCIWDRKSYIG